MSALRGSCERCRYFDDKDAPPGAGLCHRFPPTIQVIPVVQENALTHRPQQALQQCVNFPIVAKASWCGEWAANILQS